MKEKREMTWNDVGRFAIFGGVLGCVGAFVGVRFDIPQIVTLPVEVAIGCLFVRKYISENIIVPGDKK